MEKAVAENFTKSGKIRVFSARPHVTYPMIKKSFAALFALLSAAYLLTIGIIPDPLPFLDEAGAFLILLKSLDTLGVPVGRFIPFFQSKNRRPSKSSAKHQTVDV